MTQMIRAGPNSVLNTSIMENHLEVDVRGAKIHGGGATS